MGEAKYPNDANEHKDRAYGRIEDKLYGGINFIRSSPNTDDKKHRNKDKLPKDIKEEQVKAGKDPKHPCFKDKKGDEILLQSFFYIKRDDDTEGCKNRCQ